MGKWIFQTLSVSPGPPLRKGSEFHLTCSASSGGRGEGGKGEEEEEEGRVEFKWFKGADYRVDTDMADR